MAVGLSALNMQVLQRVKELVSPSRHRARLPGQSVCVRESARETGVVGFQVCNCRTNRKLSRCPVG